MWHTVARTNIVPILEGIACHCNMLTQHAPIHVNEADYTEDSHCSPAQCVQVFARGLCLATSELQARHTVQCDTVGRVERGKKCLHVSELARIAVRPGFEQMDFILYTELEEGELVEEGEDTDTDDTAVQRL